MNRAFDILQRAGVTAAAEPRPAASMSEIMATYVDNLRVPVPGGDALLTRALSELRMNSREWKLATSWFIRIGGYRDMVDIAVHITNTGTVLTLAGGMAVRKSVPELRLPGLTLDRADADNTIAARTILGGCKKILAQMPQRVTAAAEPQTTDPFDDHSFAQLWLKYMPHAGKITAGGVTVTLESFDSAPVSIEITMPDEEQYSVEEVPQDHEIRIWHVGQRKADFPRIPGRTPAKQMLQRILTLCVTDWKKHKAATAAVEPAPVLTPAACLQKFLAANPGKKRLPHGINLQVSNHNGLYIDAGHDTYHAIVDFEHEPPTAVLLSNVSRNSVNCGKIVLEVKSCTGIPDLLRKLVKAVLDRKPGNPDARKATAVTASEEPTRVPGTWRGYCVKFDDGLTFPTDTGCKGTCKVQYEPSTGKIWYHGPQGFEHHGKTIADWAGTTRIPEATAPVPAGCSAGIRNGYDIRFVDGTKLTTKTGIRGTSAVYRDPETSKVYESGSRGWYEITKDVQA